MDKHAKRVPARFYQMAGGAEPVRQWLAALTKSDRQRIGTDIAVVEFGWPVGMPVCRPMGAGLYEVRTFLGGHRIARVLFCFYEGNIVLLHGFLKKTGRTPKADLALARQRMREVTT